MTDATLSATVVDDLFGIRPVAPTSLFPNADVGILDGQQRNVIVVVAVIKPVQPCNVVKIRDSAATACCGSSTDCQGRRATADFLE
jgi:hypothetical protein